MEIVARSFLLQVPLLPVSLVSLVSFVSFVSLSHVSHLTSHPPPFLLLHPGYEIGESQEQQQPGEQAEPEG